MKIKLIQPFPDYTEILEIVMNVRKLVSFKLPKLIQYKKFHFLDVLYSFIIFFTDTNCVYKHICKGVASVLFLINR